MSPSVAQIAYITLFGLTAVVCLGALVLARQVEDTHTRRGLSALLILSAAWAAAQVGHLLVPEPEIATASYTTGLVIGLATVGAWLYFCSAYAGRSYHTDPFYRRLALAIYIPIVAFKLSNTWHGLYFETTTVPTPFRHVTVQEQPTFWIIAGLAYVLSAFGFYMLWDSFEESRAPSRAAKAVVVLAVLPVAFDIIGYLSPPPVLAVNYEPVGVGLFAIGALYIVREPFFVVSRYGRTQLIDRIDDAVLILDVDERVRDYNDAALDLFPELARSETANIEGLSDEISPHVFSDGGTVEITRDGTERYFIITTTPITAGATEIGRGVVCTDVTEIERQRRELRRKDEQLEGFATAITHELRNSVGIIGGQAELASRMAAETGDSTIQSRIGKIIEETSNMEEIVEQLQTLARYSQTISETEFVGIGDVARTAVRQSDTEALDVAVEDPVDVEADEERLRELLIRAFEFGAENGVSEIVVRGHGTGFSIEYDSQFPDGFDEDALFAYGNAVPNPDSAMMLPNVQMLATTHGWEAEIVDEDRSGASIDIKDAQTK